MPETDTMNREVINQTLLTYLMNHAPVFVMLLDRGGKVVMVNEYARELVGGDVRLKTFGDVFVDFAKSLNLSVLTEDPEEAHLLNVTTYIRDCQRPSTSTLWILETASLPSENQIPESSSHCAKIS